jgi:hypothetical protein
MIASFDTIMQVFFIGPKGLANISLTWEAELARNLLSEATASYVTNR